MSISVQIDQINHPWVSVSYVEHDEVSFDLPLSLFKHLGLDPQEGQVYQLTMNQDLQAQGALYTQTQNQLQSLVEDDDGGDFSL